MSEANQETSESTSSVDDQVAAVFQNVPTTVQPTSDDVSEPDTPFALDDGDLDEETQKAPTEQAPTEKKEDPPEKKEEEKTTEETKPEEEGKVKTEDDSTTATVDAEAEAKAENARLEQELLGNGQTEAATDPVWQTRYNEANRHITRQDQEKIEEKAKMDELMDSVGVKVIDTENGYAFVATDEAKTFKAEDVKLQDILDTLSSKEKELFDAEDGDIDKAVELVTKKVSEIFASKVVPVTAKSEDSIISQVEANAVYDEFSKAKLSDGSLRFPDCETESVQAKLKTAMDSNDAETTALRNAAWKDKTMMRVFHEYAWLKVFRSTNHIKTLEAARKAKLASETEKNEQGVVVSGSGGEQSGAVKSAESSSASADGLALVMGSDGGGGGFSL